MNPIAINLGIIQIYWYSITMLLAILSGTFIFYRGMKKNKFNSEIISDLIFYCVIFGIIGARVYYVLFNLRYYLANPIEIIEIWNGGLAIHGAIIGGVIYMILYAKKKNLHILKITDCASVAVIIAQAIGRWGNFFNGEAHGPATTLKALQNGLIPNFVIKGMNIDGIYYVPTFYYEFWWNLLGFIIILLVQKYYKKLRIGQLTGIYFMFYSVGRFFIEGLRTDSLMLGNIKIAQLVSLLLFILGLFLIIYKKKKTRIGKLKEKGEYNEN